MPDRLWVFKSVPHRTSNTSIAHVWVWRAESRNGAVTTSDGTFHTLASCVQDAQRSGFQGSVDPETGSFTAAAYQMKVSENGFTFTPGVINGD
jgi:hypothetical protein